MKFLSKTKNKILIKRTIKDDFLGTSKGKVNLLNQKVGLWENFNRDNFLRSRVTYSEDHSFGEKKQGLHEVYYHNTNILWRRGNVDFEDFCEFKKGQWFFYYKTGQLCTTTFYRRHDRTKDELEELYMNYLSDNPDGNFNEKLYKTTSLIEGPFIQFYPNGSIKLETYIEVIEYKDNKFTSGFCSPFCLYDQSGKVLKKGELIQYLQVDNHFNPIEPEYLFGDSFENLVDEILKDKSDLVEVNNEFSDNQLRSIQNDCKKLGGY